MIHEEDVVKVGRDFFTYSNKIHSNRLSAGTMYIGGNFTQKGTNKNNFYATGTHTVELNGSGEQIISFEEYYGESQFANLRMSEHHAGNVIIKGRFSCNALQSDIKVKSAVIDYMNLNGKKFEIAEDLEVNRTGTININGGILQVNGTLNQLNGTIKVNKGVLDVHGDYFIADVRKNLETNDTIMIEPVIAKLNMTTEEDKVYVGGDFLTYSSWEHSDCLTAGTMYIQGDFTQKGTGYKNFVASGTHTVELNGTDMQKVVFEDTYSKFNHLRLAKDIYEYHFTPYACWNVLLGDVMENPFEDVDTSQYYYQPVLWALDKEITTGLTATEFGPEVVCTRGQVVTFLWRAMGKPEPTTTQNRFVDVDRNAYYYKAVLWASEKGITTGYNETEFAPEATVTRGQFVTFLHRAENKPESNIVNPFVDITHDAYYYNAVLWAYDEGVTTGLNRTEFGPEAFCTRGQVVTFLYRALK